MAHPIERATKDAARGIPWPRLLAEVFAIVGGILLAFAIDAWWDGVQRQGDARVALQQLHGEFLTNREDLRDARGSHLEARRAIVRMIEIIAAKGEPPGSYAIPDRVIFPLGSWRTVDPASGVTESLISSGRILLIEDDELRAWVGSWLDELDDLREDELDDRSLRNERLLPILDQHIPHLSIAYRLGYYPNLSAFQPDHRGLLNSMLFENVLRHRLWAKDGIDSEYEEVIDLVDRIIDRIESLLEDRP